MAVGAGVTGAALGVDDVVADVVGAVAAVGVDGVEAGVDTILEFLPDLPSLGVRPRSRLIMRAAALASPLCRSRFGVGVDGVGVAGSLAGVSGFVPAALVA